MNRFNRPSIQGNLYPSIVGIIESRPYIETPATATATATVPTTAPATAPATVPATATATAPPVADTTPILKPYIASPFYTPVYTPQTSFQSLNDIPANSYETNIQPLSVFAGSKQTPMFVPEPLQGTLTVDTIYTNNLNVEEAAFFNCDVQLGGTNYPAPSDAPIFVSMGTNILGNLTVRSGGINLEGSQLTTSGDDLLFNGNVLVKAGDIQNITDWSLYPAINDVQMRSKNIINANIIHAAQVFCDSIRFASPNQNAILITSSDGNSLLFNGETITSGASGNVANWASFPASQAVQINQPLNMSNGILTITKEDAGTTAFTTNANIECRQATVAGIVSAGSFRQSYNTFSGGNTMGNGLTIGETSPIYTGSLTVNGGVVLDGGVTHGTTIGCLPVSGVNTVRVDVLPVGLVNIISPAAITINAGGAGNFACGGALSLAGGQYIELNSGEIRCINTTSGNSVLSVNTIQGNTRNGANGTLSLNNVSSINGQPYISGGGGGWVGTATSDLNMNAFNVLNATTIGLGNTLNFSGVSPGIIATSTSPIPITVQASQGLDIKNNSGNKGMLKCGTISVFSSTAPTLATTIDVATDNTRVITNNASGIKLLAYTTDIKRFLYFSNANTISVVTSFSGAGAKTLATASIIPSYSNTQNYIDMTFSFQLTQTTNVGSDQLSFNLQYSDNSTTWNAVGQPNYATVFQQNQLTGTTVNIQGFIATFTANSTKYFRIIVTSSGGHGYTVNTPTAKFMGQITEI